MADGETRQIVFTSRPGAGTATAVFGPAGEGDPHEKVQAYVDATRCISAAHASANVSEGKNFRNDIEVAEKMIEGGAFVIASIAPSFAAVFTAWHGAAAVGLESARFVTWTDCPRAFQISAQTARSRRGKRRPQVVPRARSRQLRREVPA